MKDPSPDPHHLARIRGLLGKAESLPPPQREPFVRKVAGTDTKLADEVLALLREQATAVDVTSDLRQAAAAGMTPTQPTQIGPYRILDTLGEGGMGTVYLAEQSVPVKRKVALKLIKLGMDSKAVVARFEQERQALALMQHDGIAKVFDCGTSERGQPYFVMELVKGVPLVDYCDQQRLSLPDRIGLMQQVCAAVTHAHQKGVVHRDLKPGNVLVTEDQGKVRVKIIDFGLAKAMGSKLVEATLFTEAGQVVGTPEYMAPEQADLNNADIDTRADIYSLGVMLYEVLTGQLPFSGTDLRKAGLLEMRRVLREVEPPKPSTRLSSVRETASAVAEQRRMSAPALHRALKNDLDWLVLKALEKDRARRYDTANALSADLQRYLSHEPLVAGPPSAAYRLKKLVRRYRVQVVTGGLVLAALIAGGIGTFVQYVRAEERGNELLTQMKINSDRATELIEQQIALSEKVHEFNQLAGVVLHERAIANEAELYPAWPHKIAAMETWLREDAGTLLAMQPEIERTVRDLEARALPPTAEEVEADRKAHPRFAEWETMQTRVIAMRRAQDVRSGKVAFVEPELPAELRGKTSSELNAIAWPLVDWEKTDRPRGQELLALACARAAFATAAPADKANVCDTLAWALFWCGRDEEAVAVSRQGIELAGERKRDFEGYLDKLEEHIAAVRDVSGEVQVQNAEQALAALTAAVQQRRTFRFELESQRFLHDTLAELLGKLGSLAQKEKAAVDQRLSWAKQIQQLSLAHPNARHTWAAVRAAIAQNPKYAGQTIELRDQDITGLVPIGENPVTRLWEFYELRSAWDGKADPRTLPIPLHEPDGSIKVTRDTGIVFVLLPGGTFLMGAQKTDPNGNNYDPAGRDDQTPHEVMLSPFFLARHELTRAQWQRAGEQLTGWKEGTRYNGDRLAIGATHPADSMDWDTADRWMRRHGMELPTEAQWEYGCRGETTTVWWPGSAAKDLQDCANVHDQTSFERHPEWGEPAPIRDGFRAIAPVGSFRANRFGLYDVHGNVREWCRDWYGDYSAAVRAEDGYRLVGSSSDYRVNRGGSYSHTAASARSAYRTRDAPSLRHSLLGLRPARTSQLSN